MTYEEVKQIRENPMEHSCDYKELGLMIDEAIEKRIPRKMVRYKDKCECGHECFPHMQFCDVCGKKLEWADR